MAGLGQDAQLAELLLEVAQDLDAEAGLIDAGQPRDRRASPRSPVQGIAATVCLPLPGATVWQVTLTDLSIGGARLVGETRLALRARVILELPSCGMHLMARVARVDPGGLAVEFAADQETGQLAGRALRQVTNMPAGTRGTYPV
jgi:hypothetical protein